MFNMYLWFKHTAESASDGGRRPNFEEFVEFVNERNATSTDQDPMSSSVAVPSEKNPAPQSSPVESGSSSDNDKCK